MERVEGDRERKGMCRAIKMLLMTSVVFGIDVRG